MVAAPIVVPPPEVAPPSTAPALAEIPAPAPRDCVARVTTKPEGATVSWGDIALGIQPDRTRGDSVWHRDGDAAARPVRGGDADDRDNERGRSADVAERLVWPPASVVITSSPPHAVIKLNKRRVGSAPRTISALQFRARSHRRVVAGLSALEENDLPRGGGVAGRRQAQCVAQSASARPAASPSAPPTHATPSTGAATAVAAR